MRGRRRYCPPVLVALAACILAGAASAEALLAASATRPATNPALVQSELLAQGGLGIDGRSAVVWLCSVERTGESPRFAMRVHELGPGQWRQLSSAAGVPESLAAEVGQASVLLAQGRCLSFPQILYRPDLPAGTRALTVAAGEHLWAIGLGDPAMVVRALKPASSPVTCPSAGELAAVSQPFARPTTQPPGALRPMLFRLDRGKWTPVTEWPEAAPPLLSFSMAITGGSAVAGPATTRSAASATSPATAGAAETPLVAWLDASGAVGIWRWVDQRWEAVGEGVRPDYSLRQFKLISLGDRAVLWTVGDSGPGQIWDIERDGAPIALSLPGSAPKAEACDLTFAAGQYYFFYKRNAELIEQRYKYDGTATGDGVSVQAVRPPQEQPPMNWTYIAVMGAMAAIMLAAIRRQRAIPRPLALPEGVTVAPLSRRLTAGLIDAAPAIAGLVVVVWRYVVLVQAYGSAATSAIVDDSLARWCGFGGSGLYIVHTLVTEALTHRSLGKMICGLRVADLLGDPPTTQAIIVRNVLRLIDLPLIPPGTMGLVLDLVIMGYSPLRQRLGDMAARTLVVWGTARIDEQTGLPVRPRVVIEQEEVEDEQDV